MSLNCAKSFRVWQRGLLVCVALVPWPVAPAFGQSPPRAAKKDHISTWHGEKVNDSFFWLREKSSPEVRDYLAAENAYTEAMTAKLKPFADALYKEMVGHIKQTDF